MPEYKPDKARDYLVVKSNDLIQRSRYTMPVSMQKAFAYICSLIRPPCNSEKYSWPKELLTYSFDLYEYCEVCGINPLSGGSAIAFVKATFKALADESIYLSVGPDKEVLCRWLDEVKIDKKRKIVTVTLGRYLAPYLFNLKERFTEYELWNILAMKSAYSIRLFELLKSYSNLKEVRFSIDELKQLLYVRAKRCGKCRLANTVSCLTCESYKSSYPSFRDFNKKVLIPAVAEINLKSDLIIHTEVILTRHKASHVKFIIETEDPFFTGISRSLVNEYLNKTRKDF